MSLLKKLEHLVGTAIPSLSLSDYGEPLLSKVWNDLLAWALSREGARISFMTNGLLLDRHLGEILTPRISVAVSVDGASEDTYSHFRGKNNFERLLHNLRLLKRMKDDRRVQYPTVSLFFTVSRKNCHDLERIVEFAGEVGARLVVVQFQLFFDHERFRRESVFFSPGDYDRHIASARRKATELGVCLVHPDSFDGKVSVRRDDVANLLLGKNPDNSLMCFAQRSAVYVKYNGLVEACCAPGHLVMGDLTVDSFEDIWHGPLYRELRLEFDRRDWPGLCTHCNLIQSIDSRDERAHYVSLAGLPAEGEAVRLRYRVTEVERLYQNALASLPDGLTALKILEPVLGLDDNLYEALNLAACLYGLLGDNEKMCDLLDRCRRIAPSDINIKRNSTAAACLAEKDLSAGRFVTRGHDAILVENLTKCYKLYDKPSARLKELFLRQRFHQEFTALDNISFKVRRGETLGVIGDNGAGKSTILKIIARTLKPTSGRVSVNGRVSSLLELGSGFHPEFTGIENIYFNGSLLGIPPDEMKKKIDEIVAFAEIGDHINYPLKTYSSGMHVRLAFSVATAIDPDILVVDEALSVGDLHFQKKSTDRIVSFKDQGKTILFCSHSMYHVTRICDRVLWFKNGRIHMEGGPFDVVQAYETYQLEKNGTGTALPSGSSPGQATAAGEEDEGSLLLIREISLLPFHDVRTGDNLTARIHVVATDDTLPYRVAAKIRRIDGLDIFGTGTNDLPAFKGSMTAGIRFPDIQLREGTFFIEAFVFDEGLVHIFHRKSSPPFLVPKETLEVGMVKLQHEWIIQE